ncbi:MAG TPA: EAL domain-containing protein [Nevskiaceae bacterium]|nr:EAL domain-containing protein [Nevskiaceae bacterium]
MALADSQPDSALPVVFELLERSHYHFQAACVANYTAALLMLLTGALMLRWERGNRTSRLFAGYTVLFALWSANRATMHLLDDPGLVVLLGRLHYCLVSIALPLLLEFIFLLLRIERQRRSLVRYNQALGLLLAATALQTPRVISGAAHFPWGYDPQLGPAGLAMMVWIFMLMCQTSLDLYRARRRTRPRTQERRRLNLFVVAVFFLFGAANDFLVDLGLPVYPLGVLPVLCFTLLTGWLTWRYGLVEISAQLAADKIAELARGALLMLDADGVIQFTNISAIKMLGQPRKRLLGSSASSLLGDAFAVDNLARLAALEGRQVEKQLFYLGPEEMVRELAFSVSAVRDNHQRDVAYVCMVRDVTEQKQAEQRRAAEGLKDPLTGLPNRVLFLELLDNAVKRARESRGYGFCLFFLGIDRMRVINEDLGYATGDRLLVEVAARLQQLAGPQDALARVGGDEFCLLVETPSGAEQARELVARIEQAVRAPLSLADHKLYLSASIGVAASGLEYASGADMLRTASIALYRAKESGGGGVQFSTANEGGSQRTRLESELRRAVELQEFCVYYQPIIDLTEERVDGFEALVRWRHPERGLLAPSEFLELAEEVGLIAAIDNQVLRTACADLKELQRLAGDFQLKVSVNLADQELLDPGFTDRVQALLSQHDLAAGTVSLELLERVAQVEPVRETLRQLRLIGVGLYIDDFGTGWSSLSRLHDLPASVLKIDRDFVRAMSLGDGGEKIISSIVVLARNLGMGVVAEGASIADEVRHLHRLGCRYVQGYFFAHAMPFEGAAELLRDPRMLQQKFSLLDLDDQRMRPVDYPKRSAENSG